MVFEYCFTQLIGFIFCLAAEIEKYVFREISGKNKI
jgi:hypothetical protein